MAAAERLKASVSGKSIKTQRWQERAWGFYDSLGEIGEAADFFGRNLGRVRLLAQQRTTGGEWEEVDAGEPFDLLTRLVGPGGDAADLKRAYGQIQFLVGEGLLFGSREAGEDEVWEFLSADELTIKVRDGKIHRKDQRHGQAKDERVWPIADAMPLPEGQAIALRLWTPHPRHSGDARAPMMSVLDDCEELKLLPRAVRSRARSRLASAGILVLPDTIGEPDPAKPGMDEDPQGDPFLSELIDNAATAIQDEDSAASVVPLIIRADAEQMKGVQHVKFVDPAQAYPETDREIHVIKRVAQGLNLPPEVLLGMADANHWSAWQIDEATWTSHIEPVCQQLCADLTTAYLWPQLGGDFAEFRVWYDDAGLVTKPDRAGDAREAHDRLTISDEAFREANGFDESTKPDDAELLRRIGIKLNDAGLAVNGQVTAPTPPAPPPGSGEGDAPSPGPSEQEKGPPPSDDAAVNAAAAAVATARCREAAGSRIVTRLQREPAAMQALVRNVPRGQVAATLGREVVEGLALSPETLVKGGTDCLVAAGWSPGLAALVEAHAARTLFTTEPAPP